MPLSLAVFFGLFAVLMIYDLVIILSRGYQATVSATLFQFCKSYPIVPFLFGTLVGHLFFPNYGACKP